MARIEAPFLDDLFAQHKSVKIGDLVTVAMYESPRGGMMCANPDWLRNPDQPGLHKAKSRTRAVSALVIDSRPAKRDKKTGRREQSLLRVIMGEEVIVVPLACVLEVLENVE